MDFLFDRGQIYLFTFFVLWILVLFESSQQYSKYKKITFIFSTIFLSLFVGFRWETGTDWDSYKHLFDNIELNWNVLFEIAHFDIGYVFLNVLVRFFTDSYTIFLVVDSAITFIPLGILIYKLSPCPNLAQFIFYNSFMLSQFMGSNRRMIAMVFVLWMFYFIFHNKRIAASICQFFAFLLHRSSVINVLIMKLRRKMFSIKQTIGILVVSTVVGFLAIPNMLMGMLAQFVSQFVGGDLAVSLVTYSENGDEYVMNSPLQFLLAIIKRCIVLFFFIYIIRKNKVDKLTQFLYNIYICGFAGYLAFVGSFWGIMTAYLCIIEVFLIGRMYNYLFNPKQKLFFL